MALSAYLRLRSQRAGQIRGSVTIRGREDTIAVTAVDHQVNAELDPDGLPTGARRRHQPLVLTIPNDQSWPLLLQALAERDTFTEFMLQFYRSSRTGIEEQYYTIDLRNARITGCKQEMLNNQFAENLSIEMRWKVAFVYETIICTWVNGGIVGTDDWLDPLA